LLTVAVVLPEAEAVLESELEVETVEEGDPEHPNPTSDTDMPRTPKKLVGAPANLLGMDM